MTTYLDGAFSYCNWCGVEGKMTEQVGIDSWHYIVCEACFKADAIALPRPPHSAYHNNEWTNNGKMDFLKQLYPTADDETKQRIQALLLSGKWE